MCKFHADLLPPPQSVKVPNCECENLRRLMLSRGRSIFSWHGVIWRLFTVHSQPSWQVVSNTCIICIRLHTKAFIIWCIQPSFWYAACCCVIQTTVCTALLTELWITVGAHAKRGISRTNRIVSAAFQKQTTDDIHLPWMYFLNQNQNLMMQNGVTQMFSVKLGFSFDVF